MVYFLKLHMCVWLRTKFQVFSNNSNKFCRQGVIFSKSKSLKNSIELGLKTSSRRSQDAFKTSSKRLLEVLVSICSKHHLVVAYRSVFRTWLNMHNGAVIVRINYFKLFSIFAKKSPLQMFDLVENKLLAKGFKYWIHCPSLPTN